MSKKTILNFAFFWIVLLAIVACGYRFVVAPIFRNKLIAETGSDGTKTVYKNQINFGIDSFSGYAIFRSSQFKTELQSQDISINFVDDKAVYADRFKALQDGSLQMAVFTVDSNIVASINAQDMAASIVLVIDETKGADAVVAYKGAVQSLQDLNAANATFVLPPNSPSEFLARTVLASFNLSNMPEKFYTENESAEKVLRTLRQADKSKKVGYFLWEPYVTQALNDENVHVILDSSKLSGYLIDVLVVERKFLKENPSVVRAFVESYLRVAYSISKQKDGFINLILEDSKKQNNPLSRHQAENLVRGILWKNTLENYAHFGLVSAAEAGGLPNMDQIISNIVGVLTKTGAVSETNYLTGKEKSLYFDGILRSMQAGKFRPDMGGANIIENVTGKTSLDAVRGSGMLKALSDDEWKQLVVVGEFRIEPISFGRGKSKINDQAQRDLDQLANRLSTFPNYYLIVVGNSRSDGDIELAMKLAQERAESVTKYLIETGVNSNRIKFVAAQPSGTSSEAQTVSFVVGQLPY